MFNVATNDQAGNPLSGDVFVETKSSSVDTMGVNCLTVSAYDSRWLVFDKGLSLFIANPKEHHIAEFSSRGPLRNFGDTGAGQNVIGLKPDIAAPGVSLQSAESFESRFPKPISLDWRAGRRFKALSGTSMAAPVVAGTTALLLDKNPNLTTSQVNSLLTVMPRAAVNPNTAPDDAEAYGNGMLDAKPAWDTTP